MTTCIVTGASRGVGFALVKTLAAKSDNVVIATVRKGANTEKLTALGTNVKLIFVDLADEVDQFTEAFKDLDTLAPNGVDVIIANAGVGTRGMDPLHKIPMEECNLMFQVNYYGNLKFYRAIHPFLEKQGKPVKIAFVSSLGSSITNMIFPVGAYGASKAALNYMAKQIAVERKDKGDIVIPIHPGIVATDMMAGLEEYAGDALITADQSASGILKVIENLKPEDTGIFFDVNGDKLQY